MRKATPARIAGAICSLYAASVFLFFVLRAALPDWPAWLVLVNSFALFLFAPLPITAALAFVCRSRAAAISTLLALALFALLYGSLFVPRLNAPVPADAIKVMTFNLGPGVATPEQVAAAIEAENADLVVMQELGPDTEDVILLRLGERYPYRVMDGGGSGRGVLSRYPIADVQWIQPNSTGRATLAAQWLAPGHAVHLFAPHPNPPDVMWLKGLPLPVGMDTRQQEQQILDVLRRAQAVQGSVLLMGDLNLTDQTRAYASLSAALHDTYREAGWGFGFTFPHGLKAGHLAPNALAIDSIPVPGPLVRLDYIFHSGDIQASQPRVMCGNFSDHCYLTAQLSWR